MVGKIIADFIEGLVDNLVFILADFVCVFINQIFAKGSLLVWELDRAGGAKGWTGCQGRWFKRHTYR